MTFTLYKTTRAVGIFFVPAVPNTVGNPGEAAVLGAWGTT